MTLRPYPLLRIAALIVGIASALACGPARAQAPAPVSATAAWARATPPGAAMGVAYLTLRSRAADRLIGVWTPAADRAGVHQALTEAGILRMRPITDGLALPAGQAVTLAPGGLHIMLDGLKAPLREGDHISLHLTFAKAPPQDVIATVRPIGAAGPGMDMKMQMGH